MKTFEQLLEPKLEDIRLDIPTLDESLEVKDLPSEVRDGQRITGMTAGQKTLPLAPSKYKFTNSESFL